MAADPWALLREAEDLLAENVCGCLKPACLGFRNRLAVARINAALAEGCPDCGHPYGQQDYCQGDGHAERQDSAKDVVESKPVDWGAPDRFQIAHVESFVAEVFPDRDGKGWVWAIAQRDNANTEAEAKAAAIAAARGMK